MLLKAADLFALTKPKVLLLMLSTSCVGLLLANEHPPSLTLLLCLCCGVFGIGGSGAVMNHIFDRFIDQRMARTKNRPLAQARISLSEAAFFSLFLLLFGSALLLYGTNTLTWALTVAGSFGYGIIYTRVLKFASPQNIAIGGLSGALPPLLGWCAITESLDPMGWVLVAIIFVWTPPHFWALCLARRSEYAKVSVPMLPVTHGYAFTALSIILYNVLLFPLCWLPWLIHFLSWRYALISTALNGYYLYLNSLIVTEQKGSCRKSFAFSIAYLYLLFIFMLIDRKGWL